MKSIAAALCLVVAAPALAQPLTNAFTYQGELASAGGPAAGLHDFEFALYSAPTGGLQVGPTLCMDNLDVVNGRFAVQLDFGAQFNGQTRYLEVRVRQDSGLACGNATGLETLAPRTQLTAAPNAAFALTASNAFNASTASNATQLNGQPPTFYTNAANLASGTLPNARLSGTYSNPVNLQSSSNTFAGNGTGLTGLNASNINVGILSPGHGGTGSSITSASNGQVLKWNGAAFAPAADTDTTYVAGNGLSLSGTTLSLSTAGATAGEVLKFNGVSWSAEPDADTNTTYAAGNGLALTGTTFALSTAGATAGEVLKFNGVSWNAEPDADTNTTYTAGAGLSLTGTTFALANNGVSGGAGGVLTDNSITSADLASDPNSLIRVTGGNMAVSSGNIQVANVITANDFSYGGNVTSFYMLAPSDFVSRDGTPLSINNGSIAAVYPQSTTTEGLVAPVHLPNGATITAVRFYVVDFSSAINLTCSLIEQAPTSTTGNLIAQTTSSGNSTTVLTLTVSGLSELVENSTNTYFVTAVPTGSWTSTALSVRGVRIDYTMPRPAR
ncbi:MAG TPA: hypothetical protein VD997_07000 [Phycisphaerales bacterium]|nr:hypothetical protein [Phycisphaerales bacterium]